MKKIGIITAMTEEFEVIEKLMENIDEVLSAKQRFLNIQE